MTTLFVQSRWNPPALIPLETPHLLSKTTIRERIELIENMSAKRPLTDFEVDELLELQNLMKGGRPQRPRNWKPSQKEAAAIELELLS